MITPPPQVNRELTCCHNHKGDERGKVDQDEDWGGVRPEGKGRRGGGEDKGKEKQEDESKCGGMCPGYGREE